MTGGTTTARPAPWTTASTRRDARTGEWLTELPSLRAARLARPRWLDVRLVVGVLIVLVSVVLGARLVATVDDTYEVWSVRADLGARTTLTAQDLAPVAVSLGDGAQRYLSATTSPVGRVLSRPLARGELVPVAALLELGAADLRRVVIEVDRVSSTGLGRGQVVDVYAVPSADPGEDAAAAPRLVVGAVTVAAVSGESGGLSASGRTSGITLLLDSATVPALLAAEEGGRIVLVQVPAGAAPAGARPTTSATKPAASPAASPAKPAANPPADPPAGSAAPGPAPAVTSRTPAPSPSAPPAPAGTPAPASPP